jgi:hypothetical protein
MTAYETWANVPRSSIDGIMRIRVTGVIAGQPVSIHSQNYDGRVGVEFVDPPGLSKHLGLRGDQYMGWTGLFAPNSSKTFT